ncbi:secondary thiamine-phosphate synthase enzyme YjbQ [Tahibacter amnicola]|uniref:Secondary thiamine-phosphate synthase enzyme YjbQ n=1 Tax=Tahibacter amnicola TaxID=2976241 RepID=A0ABY6BKV1_9GAMM|nr:secondary thiamine-phosphate synthase enzyme YjbQ [Tahibacter amnicola]UXI70639.1 secondary thiamine-phosphate synthase enzyme YjbQ [Tahibacter amnicola]
MTVHTRGRGLVDITAQLRDALDRSGLQAGLATVFVQHTSCSLIIGENADPTVQSDLERFFARLVVDGDPLFEHDAEGPDDMPAHIRSVLTGCSLGVPFHGGRYSLGTWQGVYLWEHRAEPHRRHVNVTLIGH